MHTAFELLFGTHFCTGPRASSSVRAKGQSCAVLCLYSARGALSTSELLPPSQLVFLGVTQALLVPWALLTLQ